MTTAKQYSSLDNSEWMRNGDYPPTRLGAMNDSVHMIFNAKTQQNAENAVGLMTMAGSGPEVLVTFTNDLGKILAATHGITLKGKISINNGVQVAQLALKHRQNKNQRQRIVVFIGSPIQEDEKQLVRLGKRLKKNNVGLDIISFGEGDENLARLEAFVAAANSGDNCHLVNIPIGPNLMSDVLISTPVVAGEDGAPPAGGSGSFEYGVDPNMDPELALALRISMEEERSRQTAAAGGSAEAGADAGDASHAAPDVNMLGEDEELAAALAMSLEPTLMDTDSHSPSKASTSTQSNKPSTQQNMDPNLLNSLVGSLPGVNPNDSRFQQQQQQQQQQSSSQSSNKSPEKKDSGSKSPEKKK